jgi:hypothetical protein
MKWNRDLKPKCPEPGLIFCIPVSLCIERVDNITNHISFRPAISQPHYPPLKHLEGKERRRES